MAIWLDDAAVRAAVKMEDLIPAMEAALAAFSRGEVRQPVRSVIDVERGESFFAAMPAYAPGIPALGAKLVSVFGGNRGLGLETHQATIVLLDPATGELMAAMDGLHITAARTAAVSAVAVRHLAAGGGGVLGIVGSGVQAASHIEALGLVRQFDRVRCWSPARANVERLIGEAGRAVEAAGSAEEAVRGADVVVLATSSASPVMESGWVAEGACVVSVGACRPYQREMDPVLVARARLFVDSRASALTESGDVAMGIAEGRFGAGHIVAELGEVVAGKAAGRGGVAVFKSLGLAVEDLAAAHLAYRGAIGCGDSSR